MSKREQILSALVTRLRMMSVANGYNLDYDKVSRRVLPPSDVDNNRIQVLADAEDIQADIHEFNDAYNSSEFGFRLLNIIRASDDVEDEGILSVEIEKHIEDVKKCLFGDATLGLDFVQDFELQFVNSYTVALLQKGVIIFQGMYGFSWVGIEP